ncbi:Protein ZINC INDUCED FACILITATOR-LIKE 1, partial [Mucuna pruriens]
LAIIIFQLGLYPSIQKVFGPVVLARITGVLSIPILQSYPFMARLSGCTLYIAIYTASTLINVMMEQRQRGIANGICVTAMSASKVIGPAAGGA